MIVAITQYLLDESLTSEQVRSQAAASIDKFVDRSGLLRKYFMISDDASTGASVYLWESRQAAEAFFTEEWEQRIEGKYGHRPSVAYYDCTFVVDNVTGEVIPATD